MYSLNSNTFTDDKYLYSVTIPNENWSLIKDFEKVPMLKSDFPHYPASVVLTGILVENGENKLYIQIYKDEELTEDLTNIVESEIYYAEHNLEDGEFHFPTLPVGNIVILEWVYDDVQISIREAIIKKNNLVYFVYYEIPHSEKNSDIGKDLDSIFRSVNILE